MQADDVEILLVEDNPQDAALAIRALKKQNLTHKLVHVKDGQEALDFLFATGTFSHRNAQRHPKWILLDLKMPKVNGTEVLRHVKTHDSTKGIPVIILTSSREDPDIKECYRLGANSYVVKPVEFDDFVKTVSDLGLYWMHVNEVGR